MELVFNPCYQRIQPFLILAAWPDIIRSPNRPRRKGRVLHSSPPVAAVGLARHQNSKNTFDRGLTPRYPPVKGKGKRVKGQVLPRHNGTR